jgi:hypothetical protein
MRVRNSEGYLQIGQHLKRPFRGCLVVLGVCFSLLTIATAQESPNTPAQSKPNELVVRISDVAEDLSLHTVSGTPKTIYLHGVRFRKAGIGQQLAREFLTARVQGRNVRVQIRGMVRPKVCYADVFPEGTVERNTKGESLSLNEEIIRRGIATWEDNYVASRADLAVCEDEAKKNKRGFWGDPTGASITKESMLAPLTLGTTSVPANTVPDNTMRVPATPVPAVTHSDSSMPPVESPPVTTNIAPAPVPPPGSWGPWVWGVAGMLVMGVGVQVAKRLQTVRLSRPIATLPFLSKTSPIAVSGTITPLSDALVGPITVQGMVRATDYLQTPTGHHDCVYYHETVEIYQRVGSMNESALDLNSQKGHKSDPKKKNKYEWLCIRDETEVCPFSIDDGSGEVAVATEQAKIQPTQVVYLYNDVPVGQFFENPYPDDKRTRIEILSPGAVVTVQGYYEGGSLRPSLQGLVVREQKRTLN